MDDKIANTLDLTPISQFKDDNEKQIAVYEKREKSANLESVQDGIIKVIDVGEQAMAKMAQIADASEHSTDFETLTKIMKELREANKDLLEVEKTQIDIEKRKNGGFDSPTKVVHNTIFTGSSKEALEELKKLKKESN